jgi:hypothetical protein
MKSRILRRKALRYAMEFILIAVISLMFFSPCFARPFRMGRLPDKGQGFGCGTCHIDPKGGGARNPFGLSYQKMGLQAGERYTENLGKTDSDGDGFDNDSEFESGTHPGEAESKPQ